ncbi:MAG: hypothetical protein KDA52_26060, partial [Planctomycetaceae bacterium]|nr:hypothetical protein [Planctomycetaceae bacterium]
VAHLFGSVGEFHDCGFFAHRLCLAFLRGWPPARRGPVLGVGWVVMGSAWQSLPGLRRCRVCLSAVRGQLSVVSCPLQSRGTLLP